MSDRMTDEERKAVEQTRARRKKVAETKKQQKLPDSGKPTPSSK